MATSVSASMPSLAPHNKLLVGSLWAHRTMWGPGAQVGGSGWTGHSELTWPLGNGYSRAVRLNAQGLVSSFPWWDGQGSETKAEPPAPKRGLEGADLTFGDAAPQADSVDSDSTGKPAGGQARGASGPRLPPLGKTLWEPRTQKPASTASPEGRVGVPCWSQREPDPRSQVASRAGAVRVPRPGL